MYAGPSGLVVPVVTRGGHEDGDTGQSGGATRDLRRQHPAHPRHQALVRQGQQRPRLPLGAAPPRRGRDRRLRAAPAAARIYFGEKFEDYLDMAEGDWVFVPPFMPHVECNLDRNKPLDLDDGPHAGEHRGQPAPRSPTPSCATGLTAR